jgi:hypothetical protein
MVLIGFAGQSKGPDTVEAEDLLRQTGTVVSDLLASGKEAVLGKAGFHPPIYLCYGPYRIFEPGRHKIHFFMRLKGPPQADNKKEVALIEVATDMGKRIFEKRRVSVQDLSLDKYRPIDLTFNIPFRFELGYRVKFLGKVDLLIDRMEVVESQGMEGEI